MPPQLPRPRGSALTHTIRFLKDPFSLTLDAMHQCGGVFELRLLGIGDWVVLCSAEALSHAYRAPEDVLSAGDLVADMFGPIFGTNAITLVDGQAHRMRRRMLVPLINGTAVDPYVRIMHDATLEMITRWSAGDTFALLPCYHSLALKIFLRVMFGEGDSSKIERLSAAYEYFVKNAAQSPLVSMPFLQLNLGRFSPWGRVLRIKAETWSVFRAELEYHRVEQKANGQDCLLSRLAEVSQEYGMSTEHLLDEVIHLIFAGHETTSLTLTWITERVLSHPSVLERLEEEIQTVLGAKPIEVKDLAKLKYLEATISEGLRTGKHAPFTGIRRVMKDFVVDHHLISRGKVVALGHYAMCQRDDTFPNAREFNPERFLRGDVSNDWAPFSRGPRICAGSGYAITELKVVLATLLQHARLEAVAPTERVERLGVMFGPKHGLPVTIKDRKGIAFVGAKSELVRDASDQVGRLR